MIKIPALSISPSLIKGFTVGLFALSLIGCASQSQQLKDAPDSSISVIGLNVVQVSPGSISGVSPISPNPDSKNIPARILSAVQSGFSAKKLRLEVRTASLPPGDTMTTLTKLQGFPQNNFHILFLSQSRAQTHCYGASCSVMFTYVLSLREPNSLQEIWSESVTQGITSSFDTRDKYDEFANTMVTDVMKKLRLPN